VTAMTPVEMNRLRWHCRRGRLENDLVLGRFLEEHATRLEGGRLAAFRMLLDYSDDELWALISGRGECSDPAIEEVVQMLRRC